MRLVREVEGLSPCFGVIDSGDAVLQRGRDELLLETRLHETSQIDWGQLAIEVTSSCSGDTSVFQLAGPSDSRS